MAHDPIAHLLIDGAWTDITDDTLQNGNSPGYAIVRGRDDWQSNVTYSRCDLGVRNDGTYSPRNPASALYGKIGRNTPVRIANRVLHDPFSVDGSNGWPTAPTGQAYTTAGGAASAYSVSSGRGRISVTAVNSSREVFTSDISPRDVILRGKVAPGAVVTGGGADAIQLALTARRIDTSNFYYGIASFLSGGDWSVILAKRVGGSTTVLRSTATELPYTAGSQVAVDFSVVGDRLELRVWDVADPTAMIYLDTTDSDLTAGGQVGVRSVLTSGVTLALPHTVTFDDFEALDPRFCGEVPAWPPRWDPSGNDMWVPIQASGVIRRLSQSSALKSPMRRSLETLKADVDAVHPVASWLMEEGTFAATGSAIFGAHPLQPFTGVHTSGAIATTLGWGTGDLGPSFPPVLSRAGSSGLTIAYGRVNMPFMAAGWIVDVIMAATTGSQVSYLEVDPNYLGSTTSGWPKVEFDPPNNQISVTFGGGATTESAGSLFDGAPHFIRFIADASGANTNWAVDVDGATVVSGTDVWVLDPVSSVALVSEAATGSPVAQGYLSVWADAAESHNPGIAWAGETAGERIQRLCGEEGVACVMVGDPDVTEVMGPQRLASLIDLLQDCETVDQGILSEPRGVVGVSYRTYRSMLNQSAAAELDYDSGHISPPFEPEDDDRLVGNDVTVTQAVGGASYRWEVADGPMSVNDFPAGAGRYPQNLSANVFLASDVRELASWRAHLGTWDEARYSRIPLTLHSAVYAADEALTTQVATADIGDVATIDNLPQVVTADPAGVLIRGMTEFLDEVRHEIQWTATPSGPYTVGVWDTARFDSSASTLGADFDAGTDTSMSVVIAAGKTLWVTGSGAPQFPFDLGVGGVRLTVTAISGASSPQTFTITQTPVNGVSKTITAGTKVSLWTPARYAL